MYFEHRNYMAVAFLFLPLVVLLRDKLSRQMAVILSVAVLLGLGAFTRYSATVWSDYEGMVAASALKAPTSARAQSQHAINLFNAARYDEAVQVLNRAIETIPNNSTQLLVTRLVVLCNLRQLQPAEMDRTAELLGPQLYDPRYLKFYTDLALALSEQRCPAVGIERLRPLFLAMLGNPDNDEETALSHIRYLLGYVEVKSGNRIDADRAFNAALDAKPDAGSAMTMAALMATGGFFAEALALSERALGFLDIESRGVRLGLKVTEADILEFQRIVRADLNAGEN